MIIRLPTLKIDLRCSDEERGRTIYNTASNGDVLTVSDWRAGDERFTAELVARAEHGHVRYEVAAPTLDLLDERLRAVMLTEAGANALTVMSITQSVARRAA